MERGVNGEHFRSGLGYSVAEDITKIKKLSQKYKIRKSQMWLVHLTNMAALQMAEKIGKYLYPVFSPILIFNIHFLYCLPHDECCQQEPAGQGL